MFSKENKSSHSKSSSVSILLYLETAWDICNLIYPSDSVTRSFGDVNEWSRAILYGPECDMVAAIRDLVLIASKTQPFTDSLLSHNDIANWGPCGDPINSFEQSMEIINTVMKNVWSSAPLYIPEPWEPVATTSTGDDLNILSKASSLDLLRESLPQQKTKNRKSFKKTIIGDYTDSSDIPTLEYVFSETSTTSNNRGRYLSSASVSFNKNESTITYNKFSPNYITRNKKPYLFIRSKDTNFNFLGSFASNFVSPTTNTLFKPLYISSTSPLNKPSSCSPSPLIKTLTYSPSPLTISKSLEKNVNHTISTGIKCDTETADNNDEPLSQWTELIPSMSQTTVFEEDHKTLIDARRDFIKCSTDSLNNISKGTHIGLLVASLMALPFPGCTISDSALTSLDSLFAEFPICLAGLAVACCRPVLQFAKVLQNATGISPPLEYLGISILKVFSSKESNLSDLELCLLGVNEQPCLKALYKLITPLGNFAILSKASRGLINHSRLAKAIHLVSSSLFQNKQISCYKSCFCSMEDSSEIPQGCSKLLHLPLPNKLDDFSREFYSIPTNYTDSCANSHISPREELNNCYQDQFKSTFNTATSLNQYYNDTDFSEYSEISQDLDNCSNDQNSLQYSVSTAVLIPNPRRALIAENNIPGPVKRKVGAFPERFNPPVYVEYPDWYCIPTIGHDLVAHLIFGKVDAALQTLSAITGKFSGPIMLNSKNLTALPLAIPCPKTLIDKNHINIFAENEQNHETISSREKSSKWVVQDHRILGVPHENHGAPGVLSSLTNAHSACAWTPGLSILVQQRKDLTVYIPNIEGAEIYSETWPLPLGIPENDYKSVYNTLCDSFGVNSSFSEGKILFSKPKKQPIVNKQITVITDTVRQWCSENFAVPKAVKSKEKINSNALIMFAHHSFKSKNIRSNSEIKFSKRMEIVQKKSLFKYFNNISNMNKKPLSTMNNSILFNRYKDLKRYRDKSISDRFIRNNYTAKKNDKQSGNKRKDRNIHYFSGLSKNKVFNIKYNYYSYLNMNRESRKVYNKTSTTLESFSFANKYNIKSTTKFDLYKENINSTESNSLTIEPSIEALLTIAADEWRTCLNGANDQPLDDQYDIDEHNIVTGLCLDSIRNIRSFDNKKHTRSISDLVAERILARQNTIINYESSLRDSSKTNSDIKNTYAQLSNQLILGDYKAAEDILYLGNSKRLTKSRLFEILYDDSSLDSVWVPVSKAKPKYEFKKKISKRLNTDKTKSIETKKILVRFRGINSSNGVLCKPKSIVGNVSQKAYDYFVKSKTKLNMYNRYKPIKNHQKIFGEWWLNLSFRYLIIPSKEKNWLVDTKQTTNLSKNIAPSLLQSICSKFWNIYWFARNWNPLDKTVFSNTSNLNILPLYGYNKFKLYKKLHNSKEAILNKYNSRLKRYQRNNFANTIFMIPPLDLYNKYHGDTESDGLLNIQCYEDFRKSKLSTFKKTEFRNYKSMSKNISFPNKSISSTNSRQTKAYTLNSDRPVFANYEDRVSESDYLIQKYAKLLKNEIPLKKQLSDSIDSAAIKFFDGLCQNKEEPIPLISIDQNHSDHVARLLHSTLLLGLCRSRNNWKSYIAGLKGIENEKNSRKNLTCRWSHVESWNDETKLDHLNISTIGSECWKTRVKPKQYPWEAREPNTLPLFNIH